MITNPSAILVIGTSLRESVYFFLLKKVHVYLCLLPVSSSLRISWAYDPCSAMLMCAVSLPLT